MHSLTHRSGTANDGWFKTRPLPAAVKVETQDQLPPPEGPSRPAPKYTSCRHNNAVLPTFDHFTGIVVELLSVPAARLNPDVR